VTAALAALLLAAPAPLGEAGGQVWVLKPSVQPQAVVVFIHGFGDNGEPAHPWVDHLLARGSVVVWPRYQASVDEPRNATVVNLRDGLRLAFADPALRGLPVVAAGYSWGAKLVFHYGVNARRWSVPPPRAVLSMFPGALARGLPPRGPLPQTIRVVLLAGGSDDPVAAGAYWRWLRAHPAARKSYRVLPGLTHDAPMRTDGAAQRTFWAPLDALLDRYT
jgi:alpha-beta hydrolase superfamily lysophospholipase